MPDVKEAHLEVTPGLSGKLPPERRGHAKPTSADLNPVRKANQPYPSGYAEARNIHRLLVNRRVIDMQARSVLEITGNRDAQAAV